jgi:hypothetical protein
MGAEMTNSAEDAHKLLDFVDEISQHFCEFFLRLRKATGEQVLQWYILTMNTSMMSTK